MSIRRFGSQARAAAAAIVCAAIAAAPGSVKAQTKWDIGVEAGAMRRVLGERPTLANDAQIGPVFGLAAYVQLSQFVSGGAYFMHDISPEGAVSTRQLYSGGLRIRYRPAWPTERFRASFSIGLGLVAINQPAHNEVVPTDTVNAVAAVDASSGSFLEIPVGFGLSYAITPHWRIGSELSARIGFNFNGDIYDGTRTGTVLGSAGYPDSQIQSLGEEDISLSATLGIAYQH